MSLRIILSGQIDNLSGNNLANDLAPWQFPQLPRPRMSGITDEFTYNNVIMSAMASQITNLTIVYSTVYSGADQRKHQSSASLAFVRGIHRWPMNSLHKGPVTRKMFPFDDVIMTGSEPRFTLGNPRRFIGVRWIFLWHWIDARLLPEPVMTDQDWDTVAFTWEQFHG